MTIESNDAAIQQPLCYEIYTFTKGSSVIRLTSYNQNVTIGGELYRASPLKRSSLRYQFGSLDVPCVITVPIDYMYDFFSNAVPVSTITINIKRYYVGDSTNYYLIFDGVASGWTQAGRELTINCLNRGYELKTELPRKFYQALCNHQLFDTGCGLDKNDYKMRVKLTRFDAVDGSSLLAVTDFSADSFGNNYSDTAEGYFEGGYVEYGNNKYPIVKDTASRFETQYRIPFTSGQSSMVVTLYPGCNRTPAQCLATFNNLSKYMGFWYMPSLNPTGKGINI